MTKILIISSLLPLPELKSKKNENNILLTIEDEITKRYPNIKFSYLFPLHFYIHDFVRLFFTNQKEFKRVRKEYYTLKQKKHVTMLERKVYLIPMIAFPFPFFFRHWFRKRYLKRYKARIDHIIQDEKPTIVHAQTAEAESFLARYIANTYNIPYIVTMRGLRRGADKITAQNIEDAISLIAMSPNQLDLAKMVTDREIKLLPHGINTLFYTDVDRKFNVEQDLRLVYIGNLIPRKNVNTIIKSLSSFENAFLDIIGNGPEEDELRNLVESLNLEKNVRFLGRLSQYEIATLLKNYDVFVMPSANETLGRVYFEAMASGLPIIGSKNTGVDGIVKNGQEGFLITPGSTNELIEVLKKIEANSEILQQMGFHSLKLAQDYTWDKVAERYYKLYTK